MKCYENFPIRLVILTVFYTVIIYGIGAYILTWLPIGMLWSITISILYIVYVVIIEILILKKSCVNCYYYGKMCAFGRGKVCALFFKRGNPEKFAAREVTWRDLLPDFMILIFPVVGGIFLLILNFNWIPLVLLIVLVLLYMVGNAIIRGSFACKNCKQRELGCPALKAFKKAGAQKN